MMGLLSRHVLVDLLYLMITFSFIHSSLQFGTLHQDKKEGLMLILFDKIQPDCIFFKLIVNRNLFV